MPAAAERRKKVFQSKESLFGFYPFHNNFSSPAAAREQTVLTGEMKLLAAGERCCLLCSFTPFPDHILEANGPV